MFIIQLEIIQIEISNFIFIQCQSTEKSFYVSDIPDHKDPLLNHLKPRNEKF